LNKEHKFPYEWTLKDANFTKDKGKVFSCFSCGGGSTMGYKLAGFDVIGNCEIDPKMNEVYVENHKPKYTYLEGIQTFKDREDLPAELFDLDILDGSPPCSSFSMAGNREKDWGKKKKFKEGQAEQVLDTLFFDFIDLAKRLQPKVVIAENVKGLMLGEAKKYLGKVQNELEDAGYYVKHFLLNASKMGVPQRRERVFVIGLRKDIAKPFLEQANMFDQNFRLDLGFDEKLIPFGKVKSLEGEKIDRPMPSGMLKYYKLKQDCDYDMAETKIRIGEARSFFSQIYSNDDRVCNTIGAGHSDGLCVPPGRWLNDAELFKCGTYPSDYSFREINTKYLIGMSVPPVMTAQIASRIWEQWLSKL
jgi:DNA (cytosine-5)-methyltransferase 1